MPKKNLAVFCLGFLLVSLLGNAAEPSSWKECRQRGRGNISIWYYNSDNFISDASGKLSGIEYELLNHFVAYVHKTYNVELTAEFKKASAFPALYAGVKEGRAGIFGACSFSITDVRKAEVKFTPRYMPDIEVLICSSNLPVVTDTAAFIRAFSRATALSVPNTTFEQNLLKLKNIIPSLKIKSIPYASTIRERIASESDLFSYVELPTYLAAIKEGVRLKRLPIFKAERTGYGIIYPLNSDWSEPIENFFASPEFRPLINELIHKYFGEEVQDLLWDAASGNSLASKEITLLTKEREIQNLELTRKELEIRNKNNLVIAFTAGTGMLLCLGFFIARGYVQKKKANELLSAQKMQIEQMNVSLNSTLADLSEKSKEITDSINYSRRIQQAILPSAAEMSACFPELFIFYRPKAIVSGDFYWIAPVNPPEGGKASSSSGRVGEGLLLALADCTGHGVPGAFMSLIGTSFLNEIVVEKGVRQPAEILNHLREKIIKALGHGSSHEKQRDGMDITLCAFSTSPLGDGPGEILLQFAGANNPLWIISHSQPVSYHSEQPAPHQRSGSEESSNRISPDDRNYKNKHGGYELFELKPDKQSIGYSEVQRPFTNHTLSLQKGDTIYLFTDGYADQFGGEKGKKFKYAKLKELLLAISEKPMSEQKQVLDETFETWKGNLEQVDDVCIIGVRI